MARKKKGTPELIGYQWAVKLKLKRYFTGQPCAKGHTVERYTRDHSCVKCRQNEVEQRLKTDPRARAKHNAYAKLRYHMREAEKAAAEFASLKVNQGTGN